MTTAVQLAQSVAPGVSLGFKNRIINGGMTIDQRNAGGAVAVINGTYAVDRFITSVSQTGKLTTAQKNGVDTSATNYEAGASPTGFINSLKYSSASAYSSLANDYFLVTQRIEGTNVSDLGFGTANAQTVTLSFWVKSSLTGTFAGALNNAGGGSPRSYVFTYSVTNANTWEQKAVTVTGDTSGTWLTSSGIGLQVRFDLGCGTDFNTTAGSWQSGAYYRVSGAQSIVGTSGATFYITGVQLEVGTAATSFEFRDYGSELLMCQRYYQQWNYTAALGSAGATAFTACKYSTTDTCIANAQLICTMRTAPTISSTNAGPRMVLTSGAGSSSTFNALYSNGVGSIVIGCSNNSVNAGYGWIDAIGTLKASAEL